jgi:UDP-N-acetylglucosamine--N-acetylmuramyl-(pentapeptide) pyrophosphoryl-undecaprenol N-acetylglucosamine transferase
MAKGNCPFVQSPFQYPPLRGRGATIIIAGEGTGGHIFPAIAIANAIKKINPSIEILFIGAKYG